MIPMALVGCVGSQRGGDESEDKSERILDREKDG